MIFLAAKTAKIKEPKRSRALVRQETIASYIFLLPSLIFFVGFVIYPMVLCVVTSFFDSTMNRADIFVGLANYKELFADPIFIGALKNTFIIVVVSVPVTCAFSLWVSSAIGVDHKPVPLRVLPPRCHRFRRRYRRLEVDVQQLLRHLQLSGQEPRPDR